MHQKERAVLHFDLRKLTQSRKSLKKSHVSKLLWSVSINPWFIYFLWLLMLFSSSPMFSYNCYKRALISSAATSALRLHQRLPVSTSTLLLLYHNDYHFLTTTKFFFVEPPVDNHSKFQDFAFKWSCIIGDQTWIHIIMPCSQHPSLAQAFELPNCPG